MKNFVLVKKAYTTCNNERHVWSSNSIPPKDDALCECGKVTWLQAFEEAQLKRASDGLKSPAKKQSSTAGGKSPAKKRKVTSLA